MKEYNKLRQLDPTVAASNMWALFAQLGQERSIELGLDVGLIWAEWTHGLGINFGLLIYIAGACICLGPLENF
jgi:hypothetical protein